MAGTYSAPEPTDVDFTLRQESAPQPEGLEIVVNGDQRLAKYTAPDNDDVDLTVEQVTVTDNDSTNFKIEKSRTRIYTAPGQNDVDYTLESYTASGQNNVNYVLGEPTAETGITQPPAYTSPRPDRLEFNLQGYTSEQVDSLTFTMSESGVSEVSGVEVKPIGNTVAVQNPEEGSQTIAEVGTTANSLNNTQRERTQQPASALLASLSAEQSEILEQDVANTASDGRYIRVLFEGVANVTTQSLEAESSSNELNELTATPTVLDVGQSEHLLGEADMTVVEFEQEDSSYTFSETAAQLQTLLRGDEEEHGLIEIRTENLTEDLFRVKPEYSIGQVLAAIQDLIAEESTILRQTVTIDPVSLEAREQAGVIAPVGNVTQALDDQQGEMTQTVIPNGIENLAESGRKQLLQSVVTLLIQNRDIDVQVLSRQLFELAAQTSSFNYQRDEFLGGEATAATTQFSIIDGGEYVGFELESRTFARNDRLRLHQISELDLNPTVLNYVRPEYPIGPGLVTTFDGDLPLSDHEQGYAQFSATSSPIENQSHVQGAALVVPEDGGYSIPEYEVGQASSVAVSFTVGNDSYLVGELTSQALVLDGTVSGEHEIVFIEIPIEQGLEYFEREDIGSGGGAPTSGGDGLQFSGDFGLIKRGSKTVVLF